MAPGPREVDWYLGGALASASLFVAGPEPETLPAAGPVCGDRSFGSTPARTACAGAARRPRSRPISSHTALTGRKLDRRARRAPLAARLERPAPTTGSRHRRNRGQTVPSSSTTSMADDVFDRDVDRRFRQNLTRKLMPPVNWLRSVCAPLTPKASAPAKSPRISGRISRHLMGCQLQPRVTSA